MKLTLLNPFVEAEQIKTIWTELCANSNHSFFLSWGWIENWLATLPPSAAPRLTVIFQGETPVLAFFIGATNRVHHGLFKRRALSLNTTGVSKYDELYIEYNSFLCAESRPFALPEILALLPGEWEEFVMPGVDVETFPGNCLFHSMSPYHVAIQLDSLCPYVDLKRVRQANNDYLALLSANTRAQIRKSYRRYEMHGKIRLEVAADLPTAMKIFEELVMLHQQSWQARGRCGAFASEYFRMFHRELIHKRWAHDEIQLLRLAAGDKTIGCLYNFVHQGKVYFYQSGIKYENDNQLKPGLLTHVEAILHNAGLGHALYDFMQEPSRYKMSLATGTRRLLWARIQKPRFKFKIENSLKALMQALQKAKNKGAVPAKKNLLTENYA